ncbi:MAG TPA: cobalamin-dependent protein [Thermoanaerobaculia bacterium]|jgi:methanogenic corrinoid protein MtbC1
MIDVHEIRTRIDLLADAITDRHFLAHPELEQRYGPIGRIRCREDAAFHLQYLAAALEAEDVGLFLDYVAWAKVMLASRNVPPSDLADNLGILASALSGRLAMEASRAAVEYVRAAIETLPSMPDDIASFLDPGRPLHDVAERYLQQLLNGNRLGALQLILQTVDGGQSPRDVYRHVFEPVQREIGRLWQINRISVAQEHFCTAATQQVMTHLYGRIFGNEKRDGRLVSMCVGGEMHEVGLRIVSDLLELEGWHTYYLGANVPAASAVQMCADRNADVLLISATLTPHLAAVAEVIRLFRASKALEGRKVVVGGRAFSMLPSLWKSVGADGYAANADDCIELINSFA